MARSSVIYIVLDGLITQVTIAAFTVKHEMVTWAKRTGNEERRYRRMSDGARTAPDLTLYPIADLVEDA
jgi:hypothetical protein